MHVKIILHTSVTEVSTRTPKSRVGFGPSFNGEQSEMMRRDRAANWNETIAILFADERVIAVRRPRDIFSASP